MNCPVCLEPELMMADKQGIEIDYCPSCRGIWLDRGELDKIVERAAHSEARINNASRRTEHEERWHHDSSRDQFGRGREKRRKKGGLLADLFDFD